LTANDWKYEGSKAEEGKGGRTHTFGVSNPAKKLAGAAAYVLPRPGTPPVGSAAVYVSLLDEPR